MRSLHIALVLLLLTIAYGCSNDSSTGSGGIGPGGGTGGGSITFQMTGQGDINSYTFGFKPSVDTKLTKLIAAVPNLQFFDTLTNQNTAYVFSKDTTYTLDPYQGVQTGQAWQFTFTGNIVSNNQAYTVTSNFTIP
ncbi:MAG: hypothetical protein K1X85_01620 [Ignavibacteria bacterium]|nr:hypothetical protein [Ignavibacteria bacterium]